MKNTISLSQVKVLIYVLIRYWMALRFCDSVCSSAIETTFPWSNFKTKHIFGILMTLLKFLKLWAPQAAPKRGAEGAPNFFYFLLPPPKAA